MFLVHYSQTARYRISYTLVVNGRYCTSRTFLANGEISYFLYPFRKQQEMHFFSPLVNGEILHFFYFSRLLYPYLVSCLLDLSSYLLGNTVFTNYTDLSHKCTYVSM